jgi:uncharacterized membrane protein (UPF0127 family)
MLAVLGLLLAVQAPAEAAAPRRLAVEKVVIETRGGPRPFRMEIAADEVSRTRGLMHRTRLARDAGMLFDFKRPVMTAFWMKDTPISLDLLFVRPDGTISTVAANAVPNSTVEIASAEPITVVIEIGGGLARTLGIAPGDKVRASMFARSR